MDDVNEYIQQKIKRIKKTFINIPVHPNSDKYPYSLFTLTDYFPPLDPTLLEDMADVLIHLVDFTDADLLVSEADRGGGPLTHAVATRVNLPFTLANWYPNGVKGQVKVKTSIGFSGTGNIYLNGIEAGKKVIIVDDLLSTGGTVHGILKALKQQKVEVLHAIFVAEKMGLRGRERIKKDFDVPITSIVKFGIKGKKTVECRE